MINKDFGNIFIACLTAILTKVVKMEKKLILILAILSLVSPVYAALSSSTCSVKTSCASGEFIATKFSSSGHASLPDFNNNYPNLVCCAQGDLTGVTVLRGANLDTSNGFIRLSSDTNAHVESFNIASPVYTILLKFTTNNVVATCSSKTSCDATETCLFSVSNDIEFFTNAGIRECNIFPRKICCSTTAGGCTSNTQCTPRVCISGNCVSCTSNSQCTSPQVCNTATGNCVQCTSNSQCTSPQVCNTATNRCETPPAPPSCTSNTQCAPRICFNGQCSSCTNNPSRCLPKICSTSTGDCINCQDDTQCPSGLKCKTTTGDCVECLSNLDCNGKICGSDNVCHSCGPSFQCPSGQTCNTVSGNCELPTRDLSCTSNANCLSGEQCVSNRCTFVPPAAPPVTPVEAQPFPVYDWFNAIISLLLLLFYYARKKLNNL